VAKTLIPVVPDTGTEKAARLATELTGNPGRWVRLDCGHPRHVQHMVPMARQLAAEAVTAAGLNTVLADLEQLVEELVANAARRTEAPLELTIDARDDVVRVEVHDQTPRVALGLEEHPGGHRGALGPAATDSLDRWGAAPPGERDQVLWAELRSGDDRG
jgi:hypothetical protein